MSSFYLKMDKTEAPKTIPEIGIYLHFMSKEISDLTDAVEKMAVNYVPVSVYLELKQEVEAQGKIIDELREYKDTLIGKVWGISFTVGVVIGILQFYFASFYK